MILGLLRKTVRVFLGRRRRFGGAVTAGAGGIRRCFGLRKDAHPPANDDVQRFRRVASAVNDVAEAVPRPLQSQFEERLTDGRELTADGTRHGQQQMRRRAQQLLEAQTRDLDQGSEGKRGKWV